MRGVPRGSDARPHGGGALDRPRRRGHRPQRAAAVCGRRGWRVGVRAWRPHQAVGGRAVPAFVARRPACSAAGTAVRRERARVGGLAARAGWTGHGGYIWLYRATDQGAALPRQDRWRGRPCHVTGRDSSRRRVSPLPRHHTWRDPGF